MGQKDVIDWLAVNPGWHTAKEISDGVEISIRNIQRCLTKSARDGDVVRRRGGNGFIYTSVIYINRDLHKESLRSSNLEEMQEAGQISA